MPSKTLFFEVKKEGRLEVRGRRGRKGKQLYDGLKERRWCCKTKEEALDRTLWITGFGRGYGPIVRQSIEWMDSQQFQGCYLRAFKLIILTILRNQAIPETCFMVVLCRGINPKKEYNSHKTTEVWNQEFKMLF